MFSYLTHNLSSIKNMKKLITFITISWICLSVSSQNNFADIEKEVD